jgi:LDH2 family malate/lactate/ureidoglycolate dehydrogenase
MTAHTDRPSQTPARYDAEALRAYANDLLRASGADAAIARDVADVLLDGELMGHTTHGLALLAG